MLAPGDCMPRAGFLTSAGTALTTLVIGGQWQVLGFVATAVAQLDKRILSALAALARLRKTVDLLLVRPEPPSAAPMALRCVFDPECHAARAFGIAPGAAVTLLLFDPMCRLVDSLAVTHPEQISTFASQIIALPDPALAPGRPVQAPILYLPRVFPARLCADLIAAYRQEHRALTGIMRQRQGKTVGVMNAGVKQRRDCLITDPTLIAAIQARIRRAVLPELTKAYAFHATRMERYLVGCYCASDGGHFAAHRDNTTPATAHRRFAISINLNDDFDGGSVSFPEYGPESFKAQAGAAVVFGCGLMHRVAPVTAGARYAFLPFVYDEAAARIRQANLPALLG